MPQPERPKRKTVLCIDDEAGLLEMERLLLEAAGYRVVTAARGRTGLDLMAKEAVDAVVLDFQLPEMDGELVAREIRFGFPEVRILLFAAAEPPNRLLGLVDDFLGKGEPVTRLVAILGRLLGEATSLPPCRTHLRYRVRVPLRVEVERNGARMELSGQSRDLSEGGIGGIVHGDLAPGDTVWLHVSLSSEASLDTRAKVRHHTGAIYGLEFEALAPAVRESIRQFFGTA